MGLGGYIIRWPRSHSITIQTTLTISFINIFIDKILIEYKWKGSFLGWFVGHIVLIQETFALPWLPKSAQLKKIFPRHTLFQFICPHRTATWQAVVLGRLSLSMCLCLAWKKSKFHMLSPRSIFDPKKENSVHAVALYYLYSLTVTSSAKNIYDGPLNIKLQAFFPSRKHPYNLACINLCSKIYFSSNIY